MWRCPGILETFQGLFGNLGGSTPIKGPMHRPCTSNWLKSWWHSSYMLIYKDALLTHLLVSVPSILALRYLPMLHPQIATTKLHSKTPTSLWETRSILHPTGWMVNQHFHQATAMSGAPRRTEILACKSFAAPWAPKLFKLSTSWKGLVFETVPFWNLHTFYENGCTSGPVRSDVGKKSPFRDLLSMELEVIPPTTPP